MEGISCTCGVNRFYFERMLVVIRTIFCQPTIALATQSHASVSGSPRLEFTQPIFQSV